MQQRPPSIPIQPPPPDLAVTANVNVPEDGSAPAFVLSIGFVATMTDNQLAIACAQLLQNLRVKARQEAQARRVAYAPRMPQG